MIRTFRSKSAEALFSGKCPRQFQAFAAAAERKLQMLDDAESIEDLRAPPGNRLEALRGDL
ncbi:type II toxin-antitoxin system RelE/ParE family toxin [Geomonas sp. Red276]